MAAAQENMSSPTTTSPADTARGEAPKSEAASLASSSATAHASTTSTPPRDLIPREHFDLRPMHFDPAALLPGHGDCNDSSWYYVARDGSDAVYHGSSRTLTFDHLWRTPATALNNGLVRLPDALVYPAVPDDLAGSLTLYTGPDLLYGPGAEMEGEKHFTDVSGWAVRPPGIPTGPSQKCHIKRPFLSHFDGSDAARDAIFSAAKRAGTVRAVRALERLQQPHRHPNIVGYYGCTVVNGRITRLALDQYDSPALFRHGYLPAVWHEDPSLADLHAGPFRAQQSAALARGHYGGHRVVLAPATLARLAWTLADVAAAQPAFMAALRSAVAYLHEKGLAHNDIRPGTVVVQEQAPGALRPVLIGFETCAPVGELTGVHERHGPGSRWNSRTWCLVSRPDNWAGPSTTARDEACLEALDAWLGVNRGGEGDNHSEGQGQGEGDGLGGLFEPPWYMFKEDWKEARLDEPYTRDVESESESEPDCEDVVPRYVLSMFTLGRGKT